MALGNKICSEDYDSLQDGPEPKRESSAASAGYGQWMPIDIAPTNRPILGFLKSEGIQVIIWDRHGWTNCMWQVEPTHWMELPARP